MSFLCCCCVRPKPETVGGEKVAAAPPQDADGDIEVARADPNEGDESRLDISGSAASDSTFQRQPSRRARNACVLSPGPGVVRWECAVGEGDSAGEEDGDDSDDSYTAEFARQARGTAGRESSLYTPYADGEAAAKAGARNQQGADLRTMRLRHERTSFQSGRPAFAAALLRHVNEARRGRGRAPLRAEPELDKLAEELWRDRARVRDGFAVVPRCVHFPRGEGGRRLGCLTYHTPRSARAADSVPEACVAFWSGAGVPRTPAKKESTIAGGFRTNSQADFPSADAGESYFSDKASSMAKAFEKYKKTFPDQLLASDCQCVGIHADMVQVAKDIGCNWICVAAVFDFVASAKGRKMPLPAA